jgi:hypothetical protein
MIYLLPDKRRIFFDVPKIPLPVMIAKVWGVHAIAAENQQRLM